MSEGWRQAKPVSPVDDDHFSERRTREISVAVGLYVMVMGSIALAAVLATIIVSMMEGQ